MYSQRIISYRTRNRIDTTICYGLINFSGIIDEIGIVTRPTNKKVYASTTINQTRGARRSSDLG